MRRAQAEVGAEAEGDMRIRLAVEPHLIGRLEDLLVEVRGSPAERGPVAGLDLQAVHVGVDRADAADVRQRHVGPEELLAGVHDPIRIGPQKFERLWMLCQIPNRAGHAMDDRVAAAREHEVSEAEHLLAGERPAVKARLREHAIEIIAGIRGRAVELLVQVALERRPFMHTTLPVCDVKDVNPPTDEEIRL